MNLLLLDSRFPILLVLVAGMMKTNIFSRLSPYLLAYQPSTYDYLNLQLVQTKISGISLTTEISDVKSIKEKRI